MKLSQYQILLAFLGVIIFFSDLDSYIFSKGISQFPPLFITIAYAVFAFPIFASKGLCVNVLKSPVIIWALLYFIISVVWWIFPSTNMIPSLQEVQTRALSVIFLLMMLFVFSKEDAQVWARRAMLAVVIAAVTLNIYEFYYPYTFSNVIGRSAGFYINSNKSGAACVLGFILGIGILNKRYHELFAAIVGIGIYLTFSRGAMIVFLFVLIVMSVMGNIHLKRLFFTITIVLIILVIMWSYIIPNNIALNKNVLDRSVWLINPSLSDSSDLERSYLLKKNWEMFANAPLRGNGTGTSSTYVAHGVGSHNMYLKFMTDHGLLGFFIFPFFLLVIIWRANGEAWRIGIAISFFGLLWGLFSHNVLEERYILLSFALTAAMAMSSQREKRAGGEDKENFDRRQQHL